MTDRNHWLSTCPLASQHNLTELLRFTVCNSLLPPSRYLRVPPTRLVKEGTYVAGVIISILQMGKLRLGGSSHLPKDARLGCLSKVAWWRSLLGMTGRSLWVLKPHVPPSPDISGGGPFLAPLGKTRPFMTHCCPLLASQCIFRPANFQQQTSHFRACGLLQELGAGQDTPGELNNLLKVPAEAWASALPHS